MKDRKSRHGVVRFIGGEKFQLVVPVRNGRQKAFHPFRVIFQCRNIGQGTRLRGKRRVCMAIGFARVPSLSGFAGFKKLSCRFQIDAHQ
jgi:hypothetical protein